MTIDSVPPPHPLTFAVPDVKEYVIQGAPVKVYITMPESQAAVTPDIEKFMKQKLSELLAEEILKNKLCEFTKEKDGNRHTVNYRARAFLVPNDQVRILRENDKL